MRLFTSGSTAGGVEGAGIDGSGIEGAGAEVVGVNGRIDAAAAKRGGPSAGGCGLTAPLETGSFNC